MRLVPQRRHHLLGAFLGQAIAGARTHEEGFDAWREMPKQLGKGMLVALVAFARKLHRTWLGDEVLHELRTTHAALENDVAPSVVPMAVGLFGIGVLAGGQFGELQAAIKPYEESGFSGSGGCGDGCGGGCGGCGGCGCG